MIIFLLKQLSSKHVIVLVVTLNYTGCTVQEVPALHDEDM